MADEPPRPTGTAQPRDGTNETPPTLKVPIPPSRDPLDPLDPQRLGLEELTVRQVLQEADRVIATVRPGSYDEYRGLVVQLAGYFRSYRNYSAWGEFDFKRADLYMRDLASIKLDGIDGLKARDAARKAVGDSWYLWWSVYHTFKALAARYAPLAHIKDDLIAGINRPPSDPPEIV